MPPNKNAEKRLPVARPQVSIKPDILKQLRIAAAVSGESVPDIVNDRLRAAMAKEMPDILRRMSDPK